MAQTKKNAIDSLFNILTRFKVTDEFRVNKNWLNYKIDQVRADIIIQQYAQTGVLDQAWFSDIGLIDFYRTNFADDRSISCGCDVGKATIPQFISINSSNGNQDLGLFSVMSACGSKQLTPKRMFQWSYTPPEHTNSLFAYYWRINTQMYISDPTIQQLRIIGILLNPEDGYLINSQPVLSGSLVNGTVYLVKNSQIIYNAVVYNPNDTFTATATATFTGLGKVYLNSEIAAYRDIDPYPASGDMIRQIEIEILTKEFKIESGQLTDVRNDSVDEANKVPAV
ncbi:MAG: hypothetical protein WC055_02225 [Melioribacteraceae bacterium]